MDTWGVNVGSVNMQQSKLRQITVTKEPKAPTLIHIPHGSNMMDLWAITRTLNTELKISGTLVDGNSVTLIYE